MAPRSIGRVVDRRSIGARAPQDSHAAQRAAAAHLLAVAAAFESVSAESGSAAASISAAAIAAAKLAVPAAVTIPDAVVALVGRPIKPVTALFDRRLGLWLCHDAARVAFQFPGRLAHAVISQQF